MLRSALLNVMIKAAQKAGRTLKRDFGEVEHLQVSLKGPANFVSAADHRAEEILFTELTAARPGYGFLGEERGMIEGTDKTHTWIVDPLDGTTNFLHAIPHFAINIALQREGQVVAAVTLNPVANELFWAEKGKGAFVNDKRLRVAARTKMDEAILSAGIPFLGHGQHAQFLKELHQVSQRVAGVRSLGATALDMAWVAAGRFDAFWDRKSHAWDYAAGMLLISEAGGRVTSCEGDDDVLTALSVCAGNLELQPQLLERLRQAAK
jgi:myo-inositol-1(or 4)-monophosphatase